MCKNKFICTIFIFFIALYVSVEIFAQEESEKGQAVEVYIDGKRYPDFRSYKMDKLKKILREDLVEQKTQDNIDLKIEALLKDKFDKFSDKEIADFIEALEKLKGDAQPEVTAQRKVELEKSALENNEQEMIEMLDNYRARTGQDLQNTFDLKVIKTIEIAPIPKSEIFHESTTNDLP